MEKSGSIFWCVNQDQIQYSVGEELSMIHGVCELPPYLGLPPPPPTRPLFIYKLPIVSQWQWQWLVVTIRSLGEASVATLVAARQSRCAQRVAFISDIQAEPFCRASALSVVYKRDHCAMDRSTILRIGVGDFIFYFVKYFLV